MYQLEKLIADRLADALGTAWRVVADASTPGDRKTDKLLAVVKFAGAPAGDGSPRGSGVQLQPQFGIQLVARNSIGAEAPAFLDGAVNTAIACLHGLAPGEVAGRRWERLALLQVRVPNFGDDGLVGCQLIFETNGDYAGNPDSY
jgi:hypothetical protein